MPRTTQFQQVYDDRIAVLHGAPDAAHRRWAIWAEQVRRGGIPCFGTDERNMCEEYDCPWRPQCRARRAAWKR
ncbi:hypothetical protein ACS8Y6_16490 [Salinisphaera sp. RV14]|uniref:hypothetical protein n=1 Tax=unclassified Salinisphaera TaxID=2649847 RepID=UPI003F83733D